MKKYLFLLGLLCAMGFSKEQSDRTTEQNQIPMHSLIKAGGSYSYVWMKPGDFESFKGNLGGAQISYEYIRKNFFYGAGLFHWREGSTKQSSDQRDFLDFNVAERLGYTFGGDCWQLSFFSGFGCRYIRQILKQPEVSNLIFKYKEFYIPLGFLVLGDITQYFSMGVNFTWMPQVYPAVQIEPIGGANWIVSKTLDNFLVEVPFVFKMPEHPHFFVELKPTFECWHDGKTIASTQAGYSLSVPRNRYIFIGGEVNVGFSF